MLLEFQAVADYAKQKGLKIHIGEFGAYELARNDDRILWTEYVAALCNHFDFAFSYWEYCSGFGLYDVKTKKWNEELTAALFSVKQISQNDYSVLDKNIIRNPNFENGKTYWEYGVWHPESGEADFNLTSGGLSINVTKTPTDVWGIQAVQKNINIEAGKSYLLSFDVDGDSGMTLYACVETDTAYENWGGVTAGVPSKNVTAIIQTQETTNPVNLIFNFGLSTGKAIISNVSLKEIIIFETTPVTDKNQNKSSYKKQKVFLNKNVINAAPNAEFEIVSANGKILFSGKCNTNGKAQIKDMPKGVYTVRIKNTVSLKYISK
jgi:hypothetical protein